MPHLVPLLIRGINNLSDARYCAGMGADKLTFILDPSLPEHLDTKTVKELAGWIAGVELIGEFDQLSAHEINAIAAECSLDAVLLRTPRAAEALAEIAPPVYLELTADSAARTQPLPASPVGFVLELLAAEMPETLAALQQISAQKPLWLGPGLHPERARALATSLPLAGLVFPSGDEVKPGLRDFDQLEAVFEALETE
ncbi:phosphoribosylanthranilate isomerase [Hymenobacter sp. UYAg731]